MYAAGVIMFKRNLSFCFKFLVWNRVQRTQKNRPAGGVGVMRKTVQSHSRMPVAVVLITRMSHGGFCGWRLKLPVGKCRLPW